MTLKTTKEQREEWLNAGKSYTDIPLNCIAALPFEFINNLCHDADRAMELEKDVADLRAKLDKVYEEAATLVRLYCLDKGLHSHTTTLERELLALKEQEKP